MKRWKQLSAKLPKNEKSREKIKLDMKIEKQRSQEQYFIFDRARINTEFCKKDGTTEPTGILCNHPCVRDATNFAGLIS